MEIDDHGRFLTFARWVVKRAFPLALQALSLANPSGNGDKMLSVGKSVSSPNMDEVKCPD